MALLESVLGTTDTHLPIELDVEALISTNLCIQGNAGAGKSRTIRKINELAEGKAQRIVLDVEDEFHTLREASPRMVIAGPDGDCPANLANAAALAPFLLESGLDAIIQINTLGLEGRREFIALFLTALIALPRNLWHALLVTLDETHRYAPQAGKVASSDAVAALVSEGRKRGYTAVYATQRIAKIDKDATGDVNNWLMGRAGQSTDRERCADELGMRKTSPEIRTMGRLAPGHFWGIGPAIAPEPVLFKVGNVKTTHLRSGQRPVPVPPGASELRAMMAKLHVEPPPPTAAELASNKTSGAGEKVSTAPRPADPAEIFAAENRGEARGFAAGERAGFEACQAVVLKNLEGARGALETMESNATAVREWLTDTTIDMRGAAPVGAAVAVVPKSAPAPAVVRHAPVAERSDAPAYKANGKTAGSNPAGGTISPSARKVLAAIHAAYPVPISYAAAATRANISRLSSKYNAYRAEVLSSGEVGEVGNSGGKLVSHPGFAQPVTFVPGAAIDGWAARLPPSAAGVLRAVANLKAPTREQIAQRAGISLTSSGLGKNIAVVRDLELIEETANGRWQLVEALRA